MPALPGSRLLRLAAAVSSGAALSSMLELYPRGMAASKALRLSLGSLLGTRRLTVEEVRERVRGRYPDAEPLPDRPELDALLEEAGAARVWREDGDAGPGYYARGLAGTTSGVAGHRYSTTGAAHELTPQVLEARDLEAKLAHADRTGGFLVLTVQPRHTARAEAELLRRFPRTRLSIDRLLLDAMHQQAEALKVSWDKVLQADSAPQQSRDFQNLLKLVRRAAPVLQRRLVEQTEPALLLHPGLLARYDLIDLLEDVRDASGTRDGPPGLWLLVPQDSGGLPMLDGRPVPVLSNAQWARLGEAWLTNAHRAGTAPAA